MFSKPENSFFGEDTLEHWEAYFAEHGEWGHPDCLRGRVNLELMGCAVYALDLHCLHLLLVRMWSWRPGDSEARW